MGDVLLGLVCLIGAALYWTGGATTYRVAVKKKMDKGFGWISGALMTSGIYGGLLLYFALTTQIFDVKKGTTPNGFLNVLIFGGMAIMLTALMFMLFGNDEQGVEVGAFTWPVLVFIVLPLAWVVSFGGQAKTLLTRGPQKWGSYIGDWIVGDDK